jgi:hypothetical protein
LSSSVGFIYMDITGLLLYNTTRCVSGSMDLLSMIITEFIFFGSVSLFCSDSSICILLIYSYTILPDVFPAQRIHLLWLLLDLFSSGQ